MIKSLFSLFLILNSIVGLLLWEGTQFGELLTRNDGYSIIYFVINFIISNILNVIINGEFIIVSTLLLFLFIILILLGLCLGVPYYFIFEILDLNDKIPFPWVIYGFSVLILINVVMSPIVRFILQVLQKGVNDFFDNLKNNLINDAINDAPNNNNEK